MVTQKWRRQSNENLNEKETTMNKNNRRSSLRKAPCNEDETSTTAMRIKRRISFSGKKSVREFVNTEEPKNWDNSYEVSDHLNVEDSSGSGSGTASHTNDRTSEDKENISLPMASICERSHIDITLNLQTSVDVTLLPCELLRKQQQKKPLTAVRDSLVLSLEERQRLQDAVNDRRIMDKTLDLMSGSLVARMQKSIVHNTSDACMPELMAPITERESSVHTTTAANCIGDSFMDITPLAFAPASAAPASHPPIQQLEPEDIELEMFDDKPRLITNEKENINPAQKSLHMKMEDVDKENVNPVQKSLFMEMEEAGKQIKNKTQLEVVDISLACSLNVSPERDLLAPANMSFESASSANSTINYKDESMLIPLDMISGKRISKKINLRQLNDELEAGKIQLFPNGPKTPTTDRKIQKKRFWHGLGQEGTEAEEGYPARDIRSSIKPRAMLNFSESLAMSPQPMAPVQKELKDKAQDKDKDDKRKYRLSQADEMMLDNTNFLAHARLGDETQSRNTSKNSTRRETTYDYSELDVEGPTSRQDFHPPMPSSRPRQTIHQIEEMDADQLAAFSASPAVKSTAPPPRRTLYMNESMDQEATDVQRHKEAKEETKPPVYTSVITKRRETLLMQVSMEEDMDLNMTDPPDGYPKTNKSRQTLHSEPIEEEMPQEQSTLYPSYKPRKTITMPEAIEEDMSILQPREPSLQKYKALEAPHRPKSRHTLLMAEPIEEEDLAAIKPAKISEKEDLLELDLEIPASRQVFQPMPSSKPRQTIHQPEEMQQDLPELPAAIPAVKTSLPRRTLYMNESIEQEVIKTLHVSEEVEVRKEEKATLSEHLEKHTAIVPANIKTKRRETILMQESMEEDIISPLKELNLKSSALEKSKARHTLHLAEPLELEKDINPVKDFPLEVSAPAKNQMKSRQTLLLDEVMDEEVDAKPTEKQSDLFSYSKRRDTIIMSKPIEEEDALYTNIEAITDAKSRHSLFLEAPTETEMRSKANQTSNCIKTLINPEPIEEEEIVPHLKEHCLPKLPRHTLYLEEPIEEEMRYNEEERSNCNQSSKPRKTIIKSEPLKEVQKHNTTEEPSLQYQRKKPRQTLVMSVPIEEDQQVANNFSTQEEQPRLKSRNTILMAEPILEDFGIKTKQQTLVNKPESLDYQSPQETIQNADLQVITPMPNPRLTSIYRELGNFTPGMSLTEFEDQEEMCKTPLPKSKQKQRSIYQPTKMELMDASGFGTPVSHGNHKRLPKHLTPNLPESKKRHTQLFADSQMEMEIEMEDGAWEGANNELEADVETHKARSTFRIDQFDETVQPVRDYRAALSQLHNVSSLDDIVVNPQQSELEEKPITISDVTNYFLQEKQEEQRKSSDRESGASSDRTFKSYAVTNTKFINLSGDTTIFAGAVDVDEEEENDMEPQNQIDNEQISLVSTLAEETVEADENEEDEQPDRKLELCQAQISPFVLAGSSASCKKCGNCNRSLSETKLSADSFILPQQNLFDFTKESQRLRRLRLKPSFEEMQKHWKMKSLEMVNESLDETKVEEKPFHWDKSKLMQKLKSPQSRRNRGIAPAKSRESFFGRLDRLLAEQQPNWIFDFQLKVSRQLIFYHRLLTTFRIVVNYNVLDEQDESAIRVCSITEDNAVASPPERWTTFEHYLNFQLSLKLPMNLTDAIGGSDVECFRKFLHRIDQNVVEIKRTFHKLMTVLTATNARLLRQSNRIFVRKTVIKCIEDEPLIRFERLIFLVQITNVEEICFSDVLQPELYLFNENLQFLPKGIAFLDAFLPNPEQYLKTQI